MIRHLPRARPLDLSLRIPLLAVAPAVVLSAACVAPEPPIVLPSAAELHVVEDTSGRPTAVDAVGLDEELLSRLREASWSTEDWSAVFVVAEAEGAGVTGDYRVTRDGVRFVPNQPFTRRTRYVARWRNDAESELVFEPSRDGAAPTTQVSAIYPSADLVPQNLAHLHIRFTGPMTRGRAFEHVLVYPDGGGEPVRPFELAESGDPSALREDWSEDGQRLTLSLARDDEGRPLLQIASRYRLVIDRGWEDSHGVPLRDTFEKVFAVSKNDRDPPDPTTWRVTPPVSTAAPLTVDFPAPLDHVRLEGALAVLSQDRTLSGSVRISNEERRWVFSPKRPWSNGRYVVRVIGEVEDPSGNVLGRSGNSGDQTVSAGAGTVLPFVVDIPEPPRRSSRRGG